MTDQQKRPELTAKERKLLAFVMARYQEQLVKYGGEKLYLKAVRADVKRGRTTPLTLEMILACIAVSRG